MASTRPIKKVVLIGASGNIGSLLVSPLRDAFELTLVTRPSSKGPFPEGIPVRRADYTLEGLAQAFQGQDAVVSAMGGADFLSQKVMIDAAIEAGVQHFLPSEFSSNTTATAGRELVPLFEAKWEVLEHLKSKEGKGLIWTGLATGPLLDWGLAGGFLGFDIKARKAKVWDGGHTLFSTITVADLGKAVVGVLKNQEATKNRYVFAYSITASQERILKELENATGQAWEVEPIDTATDVAAGQELLAAGNFFGAFKLVQANFWGNLPKMGQNFEADEPQGLVNEVLDIEQKRLDDIVKDVLASQA